MYAIKAIQLIGTALFGPAAYLAWRLTLRPAWALGIGVVAMLPFIEPVKPYPQIALVMLVPVLVSYPARRPPRRGPHRTRGRRARPDVRRRNRSALHALLRLVRLVRARGGSSLSCWWPRGGPHCGRRWCWPARRWSTFLLVTWWHLTGLLAPTGGTSDNFFYFDTNTEPTYFAMWRNDRPQDVGNVWPPLGELGGVGLFTILLAVGLGVAIWLGLATDRGDHSGPQPRSAPGCCGCGWPVSNGPPRPFGSTRARR